MAGSLPPSGVETRTSHSSRFLSLLPHCHNWTSDPHIQEVSQPDCTEVSLGLGKCSDTSLSHKTSAATDTDTVHCTLVTRQSSVWLEPKAVFTSLAVLFCTARYYPNSWQWRGLYCLDRVHCDLHPASAICRRQWKPWRQLHRHEPVAKGMNSGIPSIPIRLVLGLWVPILNEGPKGLWKGPCSP